MLTPLSHHHGAAHADPAPSSRTPRQDEPHRTADERAGAAGTRRDFAKGMHSHTLPQPDHTAIVAELTACADNVATALRDAHADRAMRLRAQALAHVYDALLDEAPAAVVAAAARFAADRTDAIDDAVREAGIGAVVASQWRALVLQRGLTPARATALATHLATWLAPAELLVVFAHEAEGSGLVDAARVLLDAAKRRCPGSLGPSACRIDRALLSATGEALDHPGVGCVFDDDGALTLIETAGFSLHGNGARLRIGDGGGDFHQQGYRGGSGFVVDECWRDGAAQGVLCSPWHDGEDVARREPFVVWALGCVVAVVEEARAAQRATTTKTRASQKTTSTRSARKRSRAAR